MRFYFGASAQTRYQAPPPLVRQGERVRSDWLFKFFLDVQPIRPWLRVKMPSFHLSQEDARTLVRWFKVRSGLPSDGEVFVAPVGQGRFVHVTRNPGVRYRQARFLPDGSSSRKR